MAPHADEPFVVAVTDTSSTIIPDPITTKNSTQSFSSQSRPWEISSILPHRKTHAPMSKGVAAFGSADLFKSPSNATKPLAQRWDTRLSVESTARQPSSLKGAMKYFTPDMISLCGGLPSSNYFPFENMAIKVPSPNAFSEQETARTGAVLTSGKHDVRDDVSQYDLSIALNYGQSMGPPQLLRFVTEHTELVHSPRYRDWDICLTVGSTSALEIALRMFCQRGDYIIAEEYCFSSAIETALPMGLRPVGIKMDNSGLLPEHLDEVLSNWDETTRQGPKPFVLYTVPTGQNPTGYTQPLSRRKAIYTIAQKHDILILEDEPYYFLQMEKYTSGHTHTIPQPFTPMPPDKFLSSLIPSYLSLDTTGRVLRLDSFSKIIAPGSRIGFVTAPVQIVERFVRHQEVSSQTPSGFAMMALYKLLEEKWGHEGFLGWLGFIRAEYTRRRDVIVNACEQFISDQVASWTPPDAGMFFWITVDAAKHELLTSRSKDVDTASILAEIEDRIFLAGVRKNVLVAKGSWFLAEKAEAKPAFEDAKSAKMGPESTELYFRMTFAAESEESIIEAVRRFGHALNVEFGL